MKRFSLFRWAPVAIIAMVLASAFSFAARADTVTDWNAIMQVTVTTAPTNPFFQARWGAIVQLAVFEAVNAIEGDYEPYLGGIIVAPPGASPDAAAIAAAHRTLVTLRPGSTAALDALRVTALAAIPDGQAKDDGIEVGEAAAAAMLLVRVGDGSDVNPPYTPGSDPGDWRPTPPGLPAAFTGWGQVTPFGLESGSQFRLPPPPALHTGRYALDYLEVKLVGRIDSPFRPKDRTDVALYYGVGATPVYLWNSAARQVSAAQGKTLSENARIFALLAMAICDGSIACFETKYHYNFWRPVTAIRAGDTDGNDLTDPDPDWLPLITTPAFPGYPSAHATLSGAARAVMERAFGKDGHAITLTHPALPDIVLNYTAFEQITDDIDDARVYGGIHFRFDQEGGAHQGRAVGKYILRNYLRSPEDLDEFDEED